MRNKVKSVTVKLTQQEQRRISMECKRNPKKIGNMLTGTLNQKQT